MRFRRRLLRRRALALLGELRFVRQVHDDKAAASLEQLAVIDLISSKIERHTLGGLGPAKKLPITYEVEREGVAAHAIVESGVAEDEIPLCEGRYLGSALKRLQSLFAELFVENHQRGVVREVRFRLQRDRSRASGRRRSRWDQRSYG